MSKDKAKEHTSCGGPGGAVEELPRGVEEGPPAELTFIPWYECPGPRQIAGRTECHRTC